MRLALPALAATLILALAAPQDTPGKPKPDVGAGRVAWFDITTTDVARAKEFYGKLFGWVFSAAYTTEDGKELAVQIVSRGDEIGTIRAAEGKVSPYNGVVYVQVDDMPAACAKAKELGGTVVPGFPFDLDDGRGAIGLIVDPTGHPLGMYSPTLLAPPPGR